MLRSIQRMSSRELIYVLRGAFIFGFALGTIGGMSLILLVVGQSKSANENPIMVGGVAIVFLVTALVLHIFINRRVLPEITKRLGM